MTFTPGTIGRSKILKLGMNNGCFWIIQKMGEYPKTINVLGKESVSYKWVIKNVPGMLFDGKNILEYNKKMSQVFWDIDSWNKFYKKENITFAFGTRFHGNMEALRNGVPALWITHDSRTEELTNYLHLPSIKLSKAIKVKNLEELIEYCNYTDLVMNYTKLCEKYVGYLNENKLSHKYSVL